MTTFRIWSDLHLETGTWRQEWFEGAAGQYLILAGDINELRKYKKIVDFFKLCNDSFIKTFYVFGNHEYWDAYIEKLDDAKTYLKEQGFDNITILQQETAVVEDITIFGATLWYNARHLDCGMPRAVLKMEAKDYQYINTKRRGTFSGLRPSDVVHFNVSDTCWLRNAVAECATKKLVITHHAPTPFSKDPTWSNDHAEYVNDLDLTEFPVDLWIHGHVHYSHYYIVDDVTVVCNPRGYEIYDAVNERFDYKFTMEL